MPTKLNYTNLFFTQSSLFHHSTLQIEEILKFQNLIIDSQLNVSLSTIQLQLFPQLLKLTFLTPKSQNESIPLFLKLNYDIKATQITSQKQSSQIKPIGFSLFKNNNLSYDFHSDDEKLITKWINELSKLIFLGGFSNQFKSLKYIGRGQFTQVWLMQRLRDGNKFAVKIIDKQVCFGSVNGREAVYNQIQILKKLNHPNIAHLQCIYESQKNIYLVLEYIPGFVVSDLVRNHRNEQDSASSAKIQKIHNVNIMKNLLKTLKYLHEMGIAHRDIKPGNIIINPADNWNPYIIDFGLSQINSKQQLLFQCCGSPGYMAPQIFTSQTLNDLQKCDIFSLGAIFYLLLTRQPLFDASSTDQIINQTKNSKDFIKRKIRSSLFGTEANLILQMLQQDPEKRLSVEQALCHDYFSQAIYDYLNELRKPKSEEVKTIRYSVKQRKFKSKFDQLFSESVIYMGFKLKLITEDEKVNTNTSQSTSFNMVEPSQEFIQKISRRSSRFMSQENIEINIDMKKSQKIKLFQWSGKWKNLNTMDRIFMKGNYRM